MFAISNRVNIKVNWGDEQKKHIRQVMIWQLQMQHTPGILYWREQLFSVVCSAKHSHYLLGVSDKVGCIIQMVACGKEMEKEKHNNKLGF